MVGTVEYSYINKTTGDIHPAIKIEKTTGTINITGLTEGTYPLLITATNSQGKTTTPFTINVEKLVLPAFQYYYLQNYNINKIAGVLAFIQPDITQGSEPINFDYSVKINGNPVQFPLGLYLSSNGSITLTY